MRLARAHGLGRALTATRLYSTFPVSIGSLKVPVHVPDRLSLSSSLLESFKPFDEWRTRLASTIANTESAQGSFEVRSINIQSVDRFSSGKIGFLKFNAEVLHPNGRALPGIVVLRGPAVAIFVVLQDPESLQRYILLVSQPRVATGDMALLELPAGVHEGGDMTATALNELYEECHIRVRPDQIRDLQEEYASGQTILTSPGLLDEGIRIYGCTLELSKQQIDNLQGKVYGNSADPESAENEVTTLRIVKLDEAMKLCRDAKLYIALALYNGLQQPCRQGTRAAKP